MISKAGALGRFQVQDSRCVTQGGVAGARAGGWAECILRLQPCDTYRLGKRWPSSLEAVGKTASDTVRPLSMYCLRLPSNSLGRYPQYRDKHSQGRKSRALHLTVLTPRPSSGSPPYCPTLPAAVQSVSPGVNHGDRAAFTGM